MIVDVLMHEIDSFLPQTQCQRCGYSGCLPYAKAIANNETAINRCSPGGEEVIISLAKLLKTDPLELDKDCEKCESLELAMIDEKECIGCTICIQVCPVDAIIGSSKLMHTVLNDWCTGCGLCVKRCPIDCIEMIPTMREWAESDSKISRIRYNNRKKRLEKTKYGNASLMRNSDKELIMNNRTPETEEKKKKSIVINEAFSQARKKRREFVSQKYDPNSII